MAGDDGLWRFLPCADCCPPPTCIYFQDSFDRADSTNLGADWTEVSGDWEIKSSQLYIDEDGLAICEEVQPDGDTELMARVQVFGEDFVENDSIALVFGYTDSANYYLARLTKGDDVAWPWPPYGSIWTLAIYKKVAGVESQIGPTSQARGLGGTILLAVCVRASSVKAVAYLVNLRGIWTDYTTCNADLGVWANEAPTDTKCGVQTELSEGNGKNFNDFCLARHYDNYAHCARCITCPECIEGRLPDAFDVTFTNIANKPSPSCYYCSDLNGTYRLDKVFKGGYAVHYVSETCKSALGGGADVSCAWEYQFGDGYGVGQPCNARYIWLFASGGYWYVLFDFALGHIYFRKLFPSEPVDCREIDDSFSFLCASTYLQPVCDFSSATCQVESVV